MRELNNQALAVQAIINHINEACENDEELVIDMIEGETEFLPVMEKILSQYRDAATTEKAIAERIKELQERKARYGRKQDAIKQIMQDAMDLAGVRKLPLTEATLSIGVGRSSVLIIDEKLLPDNFVSIKREPDKIAIANALKKGLEVEGAVFYDGPDQLTIKAK